MKDKLQTARLGTYHPARNFGYNYNGMGHVTTITENTNLSNYTATVTTDANGNITEIAEVRDVSGAPTTVSVNTFEYDRENRLIEQTVDSNQNVTVAHAYDGLGRLVRTSRTVSGPTTTEFRHVRNGLQLSGNVDYTNTQTAPSWTNHPGRLMPIESQQLQTNNSQQFINIADEYSPARLTYHPSTSAAGDTSTVNAKGSYSVINGSAPAVNATTLHSELFYHRSMTVNQNSIALSSDRGSLEIAGVSLLYEGTRVKSYLLGRDLNPMGRGDGALYAAGGFNAGNTRPRPNASPVGGYGNSINNQCDNGGCGSGGGSIPGDGTGSGSGDNPNGNGEGLPPVENEVDVNVDCGKLISDYWDNWDKFCKKKKSDYEDNLAICRAKVAELKKKAQDKRAAAEDYKFFGMRKCSDDLNAKIAIITMYSIFWMLVCVFICLFFKNPYLCAGCWAGLISYFSGAMLDALLAYVWCRHLVMLEYRRRIKEVEYLENVEIPHQRQACCDLYVQMVSEVREQAALAYIGGIALTLLCPDFDPPTIPELVNKCNLPGKPPECDNKDP